MPDQLQVMSRNENSADLSRLFKLLQHRKVLVVGDAMLDRYLMGGVRRISPEAPVPVVSLNRQWTCPGGAANVAASIAALGLSVTFGGLVGRDEGGACLRQHLADHGVSDEFLIADPHLQTITKTRILATDHHQLLRLDTDGNKRRFEESAKALVDLLIPRLDQFEAICISDYDKGTLSDDLLRALINEGRRRGIPCVVDPKKQDFRCYANATILTPNVFEAERAVGFELAQDVDICQTAAKLRSDLDLKYMLITRGADGMTLVGADSNDVQHFPSDVLEVADVAGAGDTVIAVITACLASRTSMADACRLASIAAGIAVSKPGVYVVRGDELEHAWSGKSSSILDRESAASRIKAAKAQGQKVVFTNGCFDLVHAGHLSSLQKARELGDFLVVGLNSDASVRNLKGADRPILPESQRAALLAGLSCVDIVVIFDEATPEILVQTLAPDVLVKGGDYDIATMAGSDFVRQRGGTVVTLPLVDGLSTSAILEKIRKASEC